MEMIIIEEKENSFLNRKELKIKLKHEGGSTPSKVELAKELAAKFSVEEKQILVDYIFSVKGIGESFAKVKILSGENEAQTSKTK
jgi:ribosomal protein S24E